DFLAPRALAGAVAAVARRESFAARREQPFAHAHPAPRGAEAAVAGRITHAGVACNWARRQSAWSKVTTVAFGSVGQPFSSVPIWIASPHHRQTNSSTKGVSGLVAQSTI